jgi:hypothetical protein
MPYRDEHEALMSKVELLEAELVREKTRADALEASAARADVLEATLEHVEAQLRVVRGETPFRRPTMSIALAFAMSTIVAASLFAIRSSRPPGIVYLPQPGQEAYAPMLPLPPPRSDATFTPLAYRVPASSVIGTAPVAEGEPCDVLVAPTRIDPACRVTVSCGGEVVFGGEALGYLDCTIVDGTPTFGADVVGLADEGDAMLDMDLETGRFVVSNDRPETWSFTLRVPPAGESIGSAEPPADERGKKAGE